MKCCGVIYSMSNILTKIEFYVTKTLRDY